MDATILARLFHHADVMPEKIAYVSLERGETEERACTYADLRDRALSIATELREQGYAGRRAIVLDVHPLDFLQTFLGCLAAGVVPVPASVPSPKNAETVVGIARNAEAACILAGAREQKLREPILAALGAVPWLDMSVVRTDMGIVAHPSVEDIAYGDAGRLAFLQYTSGSTGVPKGVIVSHRNLMANEATIGRFMRMHRDSVVVGWLPHYHDMGLIGNLLQTLYQGASCVLMQPIDFIQKPVRWLRAMSDYRATVGGGPNFAYDLCVRKVPEAMREGLNLEAWEVAYTGAEPVRSATVAAFRDAYAPFGLRASSIFPCYGMAEGTLFISGSMQGDGATLIDLHRDALSLGDATRPAQAGAEEAVAFVGCGLTDDDTSLRIVHPETRQTLSDGVIGEIWVSGPSVAGGYFDHPEATAATFGVALAEDDGGRYLRTGDLGAICAGQLVVTGRLKDVLIVRGRNHYPQDLEFTAQAAHPALAPGAGAAFHYAAEDGERVAIVHELTRQGVDHPDPEGIAEAIRTAVIERHGFALGEVVLIRPGRLPRTTSGKVRRSLCRQLFERGGFEPDASELDLSEADASRRTASLRDASGQVGPNRDPRDNDVVEIAARRLTADMRDDQIEKSEA